MIYTRFGLEVEITEKHQQVDNMHLVTVKSKDGMSRYRYFISLKADEGFKEIEEAYQAAPYRQLNNDEIELARLEAA